MDAKTRHLLACQVTETRFVKDARKPLKQAKEVATSAPDAIVTDSLQAYRDAIKAEYWDYPRIFLIRTSDCKTSKRNRTTTSLNG